MSGRICGSAAARRFSPARLAGILLAAAFGLAGNAFAQQTAEEPVQLQIIGGLAGVTQFN